MKPKDGNPIVLPYQALKISAAATAAGKLGLTLPVGLDELRGMKALQSLTDAATGGG